MLLRQNQSKNRWEVRNVFYLTPSSLGAADLCLKSQSKQASSRPAGQRGHNVLHFHSFINSVSQQLLVLSCWTCCSLAWTVCVSSSLTEADLLSPSGNALYSKKPPPKLGQVLLLCAPRAQYISYHCLYFIFYLFFFSIMVYYRILNIVPCAIQQDLVILYIIVYIC